MLMDIIFLLINLLVISFGEEAIYRKDAGDATTSFLMAFIGYCLLLLVIWVQKQNIKKKQNFSLLVQLECVFFLYFYYFIQEAHVLFRELFAPMIASIFSPCFALFLYFFAIGFAHYLEGGMKRAERQVRFIVPFILPFLLITVLMNVKTLGYQSTQDSLVPEEGFGIIVLFFLIFSISIALPPIIKNIWGCKPLKDKELKQRLYQLCKRANFHHGGILLWTVMGTKPTAAVMGILSKWRYILLTPKIVEEFETEEIEAVVAHEIGHTWWRHLLFYPLILLGLIFCIIGYEFFLGQEISHYISLVNTYFPFNAAARSLSIIPIGAHVLIIVLYIRYLFGFYSRLFERQADLHVFHLHIDPEHMISAFDKLGVMTGNSHSQFNWQHFSLQQRMDFLRAAKKKPKLVKEHHQRVKRYKIFFLGVLLSIFFPFILSNIGKEHPWIDKIEEKAWDLRKNFAEMITAPIRRKLAKRYSKKYDLFLSAEYKQKMWEEIFSSYDSDRRGMAEYSGAEYLWKRRKYQASALLLIRVWEMMDSHSFSYLYDPCRKLTKILLKKEDVSTSIKHKLQSLHENRKKMFSHRRRL